VTPATESVTAPVRAERCAVVAAAASEDLAGSAAGDVRWLLLEQPGPWGHQALLESDLAAAVAEPLDRLAGALGFRVTLLRRSANRAEHHGGPRTCFLASVERGNAWVERHVLADPADVLGLDLAAFAAGRRTDPAAAHHAPLYAVCTHGRRDACCSLYGRPLHRALRERWTDETWQCSHTGGHRFAPTFIAFPHGLCFGRVAPQDGPAVVEALRAGRIDTSRLRGRCGDGEWEQAADVLARRALGLDGIDDLVLEAVDERSETEAVVRVRPAGGTALDAHLRREATGVDRITSCTGEPSDPGRVVLAGLTEAAA